MAMLTTLNPGDLIPADHPIRRIRVVVDAVLGELDDEFDAMYASKGRPSVPPEQLLKATVLMAMYSIRSERAFCERLNYDLLFKWFLDLPIDGRAFDATRVSKNRRRLLDHEIADRFFAAVVAQAKLRRYVSSDHFSVDGTLLEAWASHKSFQPKDGPPGPPPPGRNAEVSSRGQRRPANATHGWTTDPEARMARKSTGTAAKLSSTGHILMEHRNALLVDIEFSEATGYAERDTARSRCAISAAMCASSLHRHESGVDPKADPDSYSPRRVEHLRSPGPTTLGEGIRQTLLAVAEWHVGLPGGRPVSGVECLLP